MMRAASKSMRKDMSGLVIWLKMEARRLGISSWALRAFWLLRWMKMYEAMARGNFLTIPYVAHVDNNYFLSSFDTSMILAALISTNRTCEPFIFSS